MFEGVGMGTAVVVGGVAVVFGGGGVIVDNVVESSHLT